MLITGMLLLLSIIVSGAMALTEDKATYHGFKVLRMVPQHDHQLQLLREMQFTNPKLDFWSEPRTLNATVDLMLHSDDFKNIINALEKSRIPHAIMIDDVQKTIEEDNSNQVYDSRIESSQSLSFSKYHRVNDIHSWMDQLAANNPKLVQLISIGKSFEGRDLKVIKIGGTSTNKNPAIWIDAGIHAREWIAPATATYIIDQLVNNYSENKALVDNVNWYILPIVNPDGYEYTHTNTRLWRKTRSSHSSKCKGTDGNRNWGFHWNEGGASSDPCSDTYRGPKAFSEPETKAIADFILSRKGDFQAFLTMHSYGQMWLTPWGYTSALPHDYNELVSLAKKSTSALASLHGSHYKIGSSTNVLYVASGGSDDWAKGVAGIKYAYTVELRDTGMYGFVLPANQILATGRETWEAVKIVGNHIGDRY